TPLTSEIPQCRFYFDFREATGSKPTPKSRICLQAPDHDHIVGFRLVVAPFVGIESRFGLHLPRYTVVIAAF
ncbi:hypothetical protein XENOCAPTIV_019810, partial [Xenoophorus captivus]